MINSAQTKERTRDGDGEGEVPEVRQGRAAYWDDVGERPTHDSSGQDVAADAADGDQAQVAKRLGAAYKTHGVRHLRSRLQGEAVVIPDA